MTKKKESFLIRMKLKINASEVDNLYPSTCATKAKKLKLLITFLCELVTGPPFFVPIRLGSVQPKHRCFSPRSRQS